MLGRDAEAGLTERDLVGSSFDIREPLPFVIDLDCQPILVHRAERYISLACTNSNNLEGFCGWEFTVAAPMATPVYSASAAAIPRNMAPLMFQRRGFIYAPVLGWPREF